MEAKPPIKIYLAITVLFFLALIFVGVLIRNLAEKYQNKAVKGAGPAPEDMQPEEVKQARIIWSVAGILFIVLAVLYASSRTIKKQNM